MENFFSRYKNPLVLMAVLVIQVIALATQVKRAENPNAANSGGTRLIRVWTVTAVAPFERALVSTGHFFRDTWHNYVDLHKVRKQNLELQEEVARLKMEQVRLREDAHQAQRLQALLDFKERYIGQVVPAQVIGTSGTEQSRVIYIDRGSHDGIRQDMPVITPDGIVGKVKDVFPLSSQVLMINDRESGAGVILQNSRLQGILRGTATGELNVPDTIMSDEKVEVGEPVVTSGGDRIYPRGVPVGTVASVTPDRENDSFLAVKIKPAADLNRLEEVLVVTKVTEQAPAVASSSAPQRAADILAERLPSVSKPDANAGKPATGPASGTGPANTAVPAHSQNVPQSGTGKKPETPLVLQKAVQKTEQKKEARPGAEQKTAGPNPATTTTGQSKAPAPAIAGPVAGANAAAPKPKPKPTPVVTTPPAAAGASQPKSGFAAQVKKPKPQASPSPAAVPPQSEATKPESERPPAPVGERPPR